MNLNHQRTLFEKVNGHPWDNRPKEIAQLKPGQKEVKIMSWKKKHFKRVSVHWHEKLKQVEVVHGSMNEDPEYFDSFLGELKEAIAFGLTKKAELNR